MKSSPRLVRSLALVAIATIAAMLLAAILFETGQTPIEYVLQSYAGTAILAALPLLYIAAAARRQRALALGIAYPLLILIATVLTLWMRFQSGSEGEMDVVYSLIFFWFNIVWAIFLLVFMPAMMGLFVASALAYLDLPDRSFKPIFAWLAVLLLLPVLLLIMVPGDPGSVHGVPEYRPNVVSNAIEPLQECIWRVAGPGAEAGFPDSLGAVRSAWYRPLQQSGNNYPNVCVQQLERLPRYPFTVDYTTGDRDESGRARAFTLRFIEKTREGGRPRVTWYDQTGLRRDAVQNPDGSLDSIRITSRPPLRNLLILQYDIEEWARANGGSYPLRIVADHPYRDGGSTPPPGVFATTVADCTSADEPASCIQWWEREVIYSPVLDAAGRATGYTLAMQPETYYDNVQQQPIPSRTYYRDAQGVIHSFGGWRPANATDPPPAPDELTRARAGFEMFLENRNR